MSLNPRKYWAFISYSHFDEGWAVWLHRYLESYRVPRGLVGKTSPTCTIPARMYPIFRDRDELPGASDLGAQIRLALAQSHSLVVVCSPNAARSQWVNEEVRSFQKLGKADRIFCLVVGGEPGASRGTAIGGSLENSHECFPSAVLSPWVDDNSPPTKAEPLAVDVRPGRDGRENAALKLIAGILGVNFDDLKQRELRRARRARISRLVLALVGIVTLAASYVALADIGASVPGRSWLQTMLDRREWSFFRRVPVEQVVLQQAAQHREMLLSTLAKTRDSQGRFAQRAVTLDRWDISSHNQAWLAVHRCPDIAADPLRGNFQLLRAAFLTSGTSKEPNIERDWLNPSQETTPTDGIGLCWQLINLAVYAQDRSRCTPPERDQILGDVAKIQQALRAYSGTAVGAWNIYPHQLPHEPANAYSAVMTLHALLELRLADLPWQGSQEQREQLLQATAQWLIDHYRTDGKEPGWHGTGQDEDEMLDGLSLQCMALLLRTANETGLVLPESMLRQFTAYLIDCVYRQVDFPASSGEFEADVLWHGQARHLTEAIRFLWYPWALEAMQAWLIHEKKFPGPVEDKVRVQRARAYLVEAEKS